jgi:hypothetical protein
MARTLLSDFGEARVFAGLPRHRARAMMLAVAAAAGRQVRFGVGAEERDDQHPGEDRQQRDG